MSGSLSSGSGLEGSGGNGSVNGSGSGSNPPTTHWDDGGVLVVLIINIVLSVVFFFFWVFFMRTRRSSGTPLFSSEEMEPEGSEDITKDNTRFAWIVKLFRIDDEEMMNVAGVDASIYLRFQRMLIGFFLLLTIIGVPFVALNLNGGAVMTVGSFQFVFHGFITTTADNMEKGSSLLWFHALFTALVSFLSYGLILWLSVTYKRNSYHPDRIDVRSFTCLIEDFPRHIGGSEDETRLKMYFEQLYRGGIYQVYILNDLRVLNKIHELQKKQHRYQSKAQHYELIYARTNVRPILTEGFWERLRHNYKRICCCSGKNYDEIRGKDAMDYYQGKARTLQAQVVEYRRLLQQLQQRPYEQSRGVGLALVTFKTISGAKRCARDFATSEPPPPIASVGRRRGQNDDQQRIEEKRRTFDQLQISTWKVKKAPHPGDIRWRCLLIPPWKVWLRIVLINTIVFAFMFFFTTPLAIVGGLQQFILRGGGEVADIPNLVAMMRTSWFEGLITGFLPTILLAFLSFLIPFILEAISKWEGHHTRTALDRSSMRKIFIFLLLSTLILPALMLSSLDAAVKVAIGHTPAELAERLGSVAPNWSFFLNFMINVTFLGSIFTLMRVPNYIRERWRLRKGETEEDRFRAAKKAARFRWGYHYSLCLLIFSMGVFLSTFIPLILPAALIFFIVRSPVDKYNLLAVRSHARSDFHIMKTVRSFMLWVVCLFQIAVFLFLLLIKNVLFPALFVLAFFGISILFSILECMGVFRSLSKKETEEWTAVEDEIYRGVGGDILLEAYRDAYKHPGLREL